MGKKNQPMDMNAPTIMPRWYLKPLVWMISHGMAGTFGTRTKIYKHGFTSFKEPALIFSNHGSLIDFANMEMAMYPRLPTFVSSIEEFAGREWLMRNVGCFPKRKFTLDLSMLKRMNQIINKMHCSLVIYPEARFSFAGILEDMGSALGKMAKFCKCRIIVLNQKGNFLRSPQWCKSPKRKVPCICDFTQIASKEEVEQLSAEELEKRIFSAMEYDEYRWQYESHIRIASKQRAKNIHRILYKCPTCGTEFEMDSTGTDVFCNHCHASWHLDEYGELHAKEGETRFKLVSDWYRWEREEAIKEVEEGRYHFEDDVRIEHFVNAKVGFKKLGIIHMTHDEHGYIFDGTLDDGSHFHLEKPCYETRSMHIEFDFKGRGDALDIATLQDTWFVFPLHSKNQLMKFNFTTEALYFKTVEKK